MLDMLRRDGPISICNKREGCGPQGAGPGPGGPDPSPDPGPAWTLARARPGPWAVRPGSMGSMDPLIYLSMDPWVYGSMDPWIRLITFNIV